MPHTSQGELKVKGKDGKMMGPKEQMEAMISQAMDTMESRLQAHFTELKKDFKGDLNSVLAVSNQQHRERADQFQTYLDQLHSTQIREGEKIVDLADKFRKVTRETESKMEVVCHIEQNHQTVLK